LLYKRREIATKLKTSSIWRTSAKIVIIPHIFEIIFFEKLPEMVP